MARAQGTGPIKIGLMAPLTGVVASGGREMVDGFNMYLDEKGGMMGGRKVEVIVEDDGANPDMALQKARRLVEQSGVSLLIGNLLPIPALRWPITEGQRHALFHPDHRGG